ncbi:MAG: 2-isopropylmalate synthase, partial [Rubrivivax sp.]
PSPHGTGWRHLPGAHPALVRRQTGKRELSQSVSGRGKGLISSVLSTLKGTFGLELEVLDYSEHALGQGTDAQAAAYVECAMPDGNVVWGVGIDHDVASASVRAILSAANGAVREG